MTLDFKDLENLVNRIPLNEWEVKDGKAIKKLDDTTIQVTDYWIIIRHKDIIIKQYYWVNSLIGKIQNFQEQETILQQIAEYTPLAIKNITRYLESK